jgi:hypothetical protein
MELQAIGLIMFFLQFIPYFSLISSQTAPEDINEIVISFTNMVFFFFAYLIPDVAFSTGLSVFIKNP